MAYRFELECQDNSCEFDGKGRGGMRTNGGCRCLDLPFDKRMGLRRFIHDKDEEIRRLRALAEATKEDGVWTMTEPEFARELELARAIERDACAKVADGAMRACASEAELDVATTIRNLILGRQDVE